MGVLQVFGSSMSTAGLEGDIGAFRMVFILEGKLCKIQVHILSVLPALEVLSHHSDGICC